MHERRDYLFQDKGHKESYRVCLTGACPRKLSGCLGVVIDRVPRHMLSVDGTGGPTARSADPQAPVFDSLVDGMEHGTEVGPGLFRDGRTAIFGPLSDLAHRRYCCRAAATGPVTSRGPWNSHPSRISCSGKRGRG
ncbi:hypothetical protein CDAR_420401 [Caerostris darwini]|uniref:Uncharacterized protein n=1 Tax=Caerostris darwini TaxID=1538125 RepID=A0AAV4TTG3_9ARAC|nr:hypothetical protein CDAR_420401 [Caerostris darwini]